MLKSVEKAWKNAIFISFPMLFLHCKKTGRLMICLIALPLPFPPYPQESESCEERLRGDSDILLKGLCRKEDFCTRGSRFTVAFMPYQCKEMHCWASQEMTMKPMVSHSEKWLVGNSQRPFKFCWNLVLYWILGCFFKFSILEFASVSNSWAILPAWLGV